jgi:hypothetical protein
LQWEMVILLRLPILKERSHRTLCLLFIYLFLFFFFFFFYRHFFTDLAVVSRNLVSPRKVCLFVCLFVFFLFLFFLFHKNVVGLRPSKHISDSPWLINACRNSADATDNWDYWQILERSWNDPGTILERSWNPRLEAGGSEAGRACRHVTGVIDVRSGPAA